MSEEMFLLVKKRVGIAESVKVYDEDIENYLEDCKQDMLDSGVPAEIMEKQDSRVATAAALYVKAYLGNDRTDTEKYLKLYREKVFRLTLEPEEVQCGMEVSN